jgi:DNA-binding transcriptional regulator YhcF (GntR family)
MQLWFSRQSDISIRDQLATQIVLAIVSGELAPGQRLPSTRELARRFRLHPNTVSAGYRQLERGNWVEFRKGSGIYVRSRLPSSSAPNVALDRLIADFFRSARKLNAPLATVRARVRQWLEMQPPDHFLLIEPDQELAAIIVREMQAAVALPVKSISAVDSESSVEGAIPACLSISCESIRRKLSANADLLVLNLRSARESLARHLPAPANVMLGVVSAWPPFLKNARTMLISAGFHPDCLLLRDRSKAGWKRGLNEVAAVICDSLTATSLDGHKLVLSFPLLAQQSMDELRDYEQFVQNPFSP